MHYMNVRCLHSQRSPERTSPCPCAQLNVLHYLHGPRAHMMARSLLVVCVELARVLEEVMRAVAKVLEQTEHAESFVPPVPCES